MITKETVPPTITHVYRFKMQLVSGKMHPRKLFVQESWRVWNIVGDKYRVIAGKSRITVVKSMLEVSDDRSTHRQNLLIPDMQQDAEITSISSVTEATEKDPSDDWSYWYI